ncbi:MAG: glycerate kinase [Actinomycetaceae bacterium]|nr:glycerate kinase [Actinomycetaceae bacterium]
MTYTFNRVLIAGESTPAINTRDIHQLIAAEFAGDVQALDVDLSLDKATQTLIDAGLTVICEPDLTDPTSWGQPGTDTWLVAGHDKPSVNPVAATPQPETAAGYNIGGVGTLLALAGLDPKLAYASSKDVENQIVDKYGSWSAITAREGVWYSNLELLRHVRSLALQNIGNRRLRVASATERPLLGLDSTLAMDENGHPVNVIEPATLGALTAFYNVYTQVGESEKLTQSAQSAGQIPNSYARQIGSGGGLGIGALAMGLRGSLHQLSDVLIEATQLEDELAKTDLLIEIIPTLHPQTIADSPLQKLGELAATHAVPVILFTHESSLSNHELAEWGIHAAYVVSANSSLDKVRRVLRGTWIRPA